MSQITLLNAAYILSVFIGGCAIGFGSGVALYAPAFETTNWIGFVVCVLVGFGMLIQGFRHLL